MPLSDSLSASGYLLLNQNDDVPEAMTAIVAGASEGAEARVVALLDSAGLRVRESATIESTPKSSDRRVVRIADVNGLLMPKALDGHINPRLILISHDPVALAEAFEAKDLRIGLKQAKDRIGTVLKVALRARCPTLLLSHEFATGAASDVAAAIYEFCGLDARPETMPLPAGLDETGSRAGQHGIIELNSSHRPAVRRTNRTIVIGGPPRAGTSMIAAVLYAAGLPLGDMLVPSTFENAPQNALFKTSKPGGVWRTVLTGSWWAALRNPRFFRLALDGFDITGIKALVALRRKDGPIWGVKRPGVGSFIRLGGLGLLENPHVVMSFRDPVAIAARIRQAHNFSVDDALSLAHWNIFDGLKTAVACKAPMLLVSHGAAKKDLPGLLARLFSFCGLAVDASRYEQIAAFAKRSGETYLKDFAAPIVGEIMSFSGGALRCWVQAQQSDPIIEVFADDRKIASGGADRIRADGQYMFSIRLPPEDLKGPMRIRAFVGSPKIELRNSGFTLRELRQGRNRLRQQDSVTPESEGQGAHRQMPSRHGAH